VGIAIARFFGIDERRIEFTRDPFDEKMAIVDPNIPLVVNRSASLNELVINRSIEEFSEIFQPMRLEIGGKIKTSCGDVSIPSIAKVINQSRFEELFLFGELGEELRNLVIKNITKSIERKGPTLRLERA
ncbi:MAG: hypothetical protein N3D72_00275, partial [Candidatus Methanomethyliaceae archaeon]|nr:hypothetical protein [Candidatus Methanomethyliaceae archaeon]